MLPAPFSSAPQNLSNLIADYLEEDFMQREYLFSEDYDDFAKFVIDEWSNLIK
jgi:hypothetical protein